MIQTLKKILAPIAVSLETKAVWIREDKIESLRSDYIALASRLSIWREGTNS